MNISIVIPCHNEEKNIAEISNRFLKIFDKIDIDLYKIILLMMDQQIIVGRKLIYYPKNLKIKF